MAGFYAPRRGLGGMVNMKAYLFGDEVGDILGYYGDIVVLQIVGEAVPTAALMSDVEVIL